VGITRRRLSGGYGPAPRGRSRVACPAGRLQPGSALAGGGECSEGRLEANAAGSAAAAGGSAHVLPPRTPAPRSADPRRRAAPAVERIGGRDGQQVPVVVIRDAHRLVLIEKALSLDASLPAT
jgi:hypothetical protein